MRHKRLQIHHTTNKKQHPNRLQPLPQRIQKSTHQQKNVPPLPRLLPKTHPTKHRLHTRKKSETMNSNLTNKYSHTRRCLTNMSTCYLYESQKGGPSIMSQHQPKRIIDQHKILKNKGIKIHTSDLEK